jgi:lysophospholipase L1-like esterase
MRLGIIGDSHCREAESHITNINSSISVYTLCAPDKVPFIRFRFRLTLHLIQAFNPDAIVIHAGHNDMARHPFYNPRPRISRDVTTDLIQLAQEIHGHFPHAKIVLSSILPRKITPASSLNPELTAKYNKLAVRHGLRLRTAATAHGFTTNLNMFMWAHVYKYEANTQFICSDGVHLTSEGTKELARSWIISAYPTLSNDRVSSD